MIIKKNKIQHNTPQKEEPAKEQPVEETVREQTPKKTCSNQAYSLMKSSLTPFNSGRREDAVTDAVDTEEPMIETSYQEPKTKRKI